MRFWSLEYLLLACFSMEAQKRVPAVDGAKPLSRSSYRPFFVEPNRLVGSCGRKLKGQHHLLAQPPHAPPQLASPEKRKVNTNKRPRAEQPHGVCFINQRGLSSKVDPRLGLKLFETELSTFSRQNVNPILWMGDIQKNRSTVQKP